MAGFVPIFIHLGAYPIQLWDESRMAHSAYDMFRNGFSFIPSFHGSSDLWNTKPPLLIWLQTLSFHLFGVNEFAFRLPTAISAMATLLVLMYWLRKTGYTVVTGLATLMMLVTSRAYVGWHGSRTGDYEALLILFLMIQICSFHLYLFTEGRRKSDAYLDIFLISLVLAVWTKGVAGMFFAPAFVLWWLFTGKWRQEYLPGFLVKLLLTLIGVISYYVLREFIEPGFLRSIWENELGGRYMQHLENHSAESGIYLSLLVGRGGYWVYGVIPLGILGVVIGDLKTRRNLLFLFSLAVVFLLIITLAATKNIWYQVPLYPILALIMAISLECAIRTLLKRLKHMKWLAVSMLASTFVLFGKPYSIVFIKTINQTEYVENQYNMYEVTNFLRHQIGSDTLREWTFIDMEYSAHNWWYIRRLNDEGHHIKSFIHLDSIGVGDVVLFNQAHVLDSIRTKYLSTRLNEHTAFHLLHLVGMRKTD